MENPVQCECYLNTEGVEWNNILVSYKKTVTHRNVLQSFFGSK
jgi:hypothetical protein